MSGETSNNCAWHDGEEPEDFNLGAPHCPECSRLLQLRECEDCREEFLDFAAIGYDDIVAAPRVSSAGDLCCAGCVGRIEAELDAMDEADDDWLETQ